MNPEIKKWSREQVVIDIGKYKSIMFSHMNDARKCCNIWSSPFNIATWNDTMLYTLADLSENSQKIIENYLNQQLEYITTFCSHLEQMVFHACPPPEHVESKYDFYEVYRLCKYPREIAMFANKDGLLMEGDEDYSTHVLSIKPKAYKYHMDHKSSKSYRLGFDYYGFRKRSRVIAMFKHGLKTLSGKPDDPDNDQNVVDHLIYTKSFKIFDEYTRVIRFSTNVRAHANDERENLELGVTYNTKVVRTLPEWITKPSP